MSELASGSMSQRSRPVAFHYGPAERSEEQR
jgi:hypothetical protein